LVPIGLRLYAGEASARGCTMPRILRVLPGVALVLLFPACEDLTPLGPTPPDEGIIVYVHPEFTGPSQQIGTDVRDLGKVEGACVEGGGDGSAEATWNDCISSVRVLPGWAATLYRDGDFKGATLTVTEDVTDLRRVSGPCSDGYNDCISSIRVFRR
jgi:hypothetical protein